jgi:hypothetical protein
MCAAGAFLSDIETRIEEDNIIGTSIGIEAILASGAFIRIDDNQSIGAAIYCLNLTGRYARRLFTMLTRYEYIRYPYMWSFTPGSLMYLTPELSYFRLRFSIWCPIIRAMLVLTGNLTRVASDAI